MTDHPIVSREEWLRARKELLAEEKSFTKVRDALARKRRELPWSPPRSTADSHCCTDSPASGPRSTPGSIRCGRYASRVASA